MTHTEFIEESAKLKFERYDCENGVKCLTINQVHVACEMAIKERTDKILTFFDADTIKALEDSDKLVHQGMGAVLSVAKARIQILDVEPITFKELKGKFL